MLLIWIPESRQRARQRRRLRCRAWHPSGSARRPTVESWLRHHVDHLTGVDPNTIAKYSAYIANDIAEPLGAIPLATLTREHGVVWIKDMHTAGDLGQRYRNVSNIITDVDHLNAGLPGDSS